MLSVLNQFKRLYNDKGQNDKNFELQEGRLRKALTDLKNATNEVIRASQNLNDVLLANKARPPSGLH